MSRTTPRPLTAQLRASTAKPKVARSASDVLRQSLHSLLRICAITPSANAPAKKNTAGATHRTTMPRSGFASISSRELLARTSSSWREVPAGKSPLNPVMSFSISRRQEINSSRAASISSSDRPSKLPPALDLRCASVRRPAARLASGSVAALPKKYRPSDALLAANHCPLPSSWCDRTTFSAGTAASSKPVNSGTPASAGGSSLAIFQC